MYYAVLKEDKTLSEPHILHSFDGELYSFSAIANAPQGGVALMESFTPLVTATIQGRKVQGTLYSSCVVQSADNNQWNQPVLLSETNFAHSVALLLDDDDTLWAVYAESDPLKRTYFRTSKDGKEWSEPHTVSAGLAVRFLQRSNQQYVLFFSNGTAIYMVTSDSVTWSRPHPIMSVRECYSLGVAESDDGTLWAVIEGKGCFYVTQYTDEQYLKDVNTLKGLHMRNGVIASGIALIFGSICLFLAKKIF